MCNTLIFFKFWFCLPPVHAWRPNATCCERLRIWLSCLYAEMTFYSGGCVVKDSGDGQVQCKQRRILNERDNINASRPHGQIKKLIPALASLPAKLQVRLIRETILISPEQKGLQSVRRFLTVRVENVHRPRCVVRLNVVTYGQSIVDFFQTPRTIVLLWFTVCLPGRVR